MKKNEGNRCHKCNFQKNGMCMATNPSIQHKPFGFPFLYDENKVICLSYKKESIDKIVTWEHM